MVDLRFEEAEKILLKALKIVEQRGDFSRIAHIFKNIGLLYREMENREKALFYYKKHIELLTDVTHQFKAVTKEKIT